MDFPRSLDGCDSVLFTDDHRGWDAYLGQGLSQVSPGNHGAILSDEGSGADSRAHLYEFGADIVGRRRMDQRRNAPLGQPPKVACHPGNKVSEMPVRSPTESVGPRVRIHPGQSAHALGRDLNQLQRHHSAHGDAGESEAFWSLVKDAAGHARESLVAERIAHPAVNLAVERCDRPSPDRAIAAEPGDKNEGLHRHIYRLD
jgi:hypothetical protein